MNTAVRRVLQSKEQNVVRVKTTDTAYQAIEAMARAHAGSVLVMDDKDRLKGILTERDCFTKIILPEKAPRQVKVSEAMSRRIVVVSPDQSIEECMVIMSEKHIRHLPVLEGDKVLGVVSMRDLVRYLVREQDLMIRNLERYIDGSL